MVIFEPPGGIQYHHCMKKYLVLFIGIAVFFSCSHKKTPVSSDEIENPHDFIDFFPSLSLPFQFTDTLFKHRGRDSLLGYKTVLKFIPDSVFYNHFGKGTKPKLYTVGRIGVKKNETYLFVKAISPVKKIIYLLCFDKTDKFVASLPLIVSEGEPSVNWLAGMDNKYTISTTRQHKSANGQIFYRRWVYVYNDVGVFTLILTESNESKPKNFEIINPIDTLSHKHKFTGDYIQDKRNFISVRDGKNSSYVVFFVHFEKDDGECKGELKGEARFISSTSARYKGNGDPCIVDFSFADNSVRMHEVEGCGNHRDIKCFFEGSYTKKKETKPKPVKKKK
jgi:hypothetical protein